MARTATAPVFLSEWNSLANAGSCLELKDSWNHVLEYAKEIAPRGLNELWDFYLERLDNLEGKPGSTLILNKEKK